MWGSGNYRQIEYFKHPNVITVQIIQVQVVEFAPTAYYLLDTSQSIYGWFAADGTHSGYESTPVLVESQGYVRTSSMRVVVGTEIIGDATRDLELILF
jgi:hypothetical protein